MERAASILGRSDAAAAPANPFENVPPDVRRRCAERLAEAEARERAERARRNLRDAGIPAAFVRARIEDAHPTVRRWADAVASGRGDWLLLKGKNGRGKSTQACAALIRVAEERRVEFATMQDILDRAEARKGESRREAIDYFKAVPVLLIDDFGKEDPASWNLTRVFQVLDGRWRERRPTVITTNMDSKAMIAHMRQGDQGGTMVDSIISRLGSATVVELDGPDWRMRKGA